MKKILATLVAFGLVFQTCAFAANDMTVSYNKDTNKISADATVGTDANTPVVLTVAEDNGEALSIDNLPVFMYLYKTAAEGILDLDITMSADIASGKYVVSYNAKSGSDSKKVMIVNVNDNSVGGTVSVLAEINGAADGTALKTVISDSAKMIKLGVDPDLMAARASFAAYAAEILVAEKDGNWTVDSFITDYNEALALSAAKAGQHVDTVMENYASVFGITNETYEAYDADTKAYIATFLTTVDYLTEDPAVKFANMYALIDYKVIDTWGELRQVIEEKREAGEAPFNFSAYDEIDRTNHEDLFTQMLPLIAACETIEDVAEVFENVTYEVYDEQINPDPEETEPPSSVVNTPVPDNSGTKIPAGKPSGNVTVETGTKTTPAPYDDKTEKATPAPTVEPEETEAPVATEAPALEAGVFVDTADHWAKDYIKALADSGVVGGYDDGTFLPNKNVTRAEYIKMIVGLFELEETAENPFADVADTAWYKEYVEKAVSAGLIEGDGGNFNPDATITRQDAAVILHRLGLITAGDTEMAFADEASVADYAKDAVDTLASAGIINGSDGNFNPANAITRAETATILCRAAIVIADDVVTEEEAVTEETTEEEVVEDVTEEVVEETTDEATEDATEEEVVEDTTDETEAVVDETTKETADEATETE